MLRLLCFGFILPIIDSQADRPGQPDKHWWVALLLLLILLLAFIIPFLCRQLCFLSRENTLRPTDRGLAKVAQVARYRQAVWNTHLNEVPSSIPPSGRYVGEFKDGNDSRFLDYELNFDNEGTVKGSLRSQQKTFVVQGFYHETKGVYLWGETDNVHRFDNTEEPSDIERKIIANRIFHSEAEVRIKDAQKGFLFVSFLCSTGSKGTFHCNHCPVGQVSSDMIL